MENKLYFHSIYQSSCLAGLARSMTDYEISLELEVQEIEIKNWIKELKKIIGVKHREELVRVSKIIFNINTCQ